jgi:hypothetical protein
MDPPVELGLVSAAVGPLLLEQADNKYNPAMTTT